MTFLVFECRMLAEVIKKSIAGRARGDMDPSCESMTGLFFCVLGLPALCQCHMSMMFVLNRFLKPIIRPTYIWHHKRKADSSNISCYSCTCLLQPSKRMDLPRPGACSVGFFLPCLGPVPALDQVHKININQSVKQAFAALSTKLSTEICGHDLRCC
jgi:hypothetical protein